ncbi:ead/Ea22-like family protein [Citrobacter meridianamericanus]|uniref:ead/Ea22-like family protein n=1 Tax=Citrobacter meridianamericanus TaxID=2894201 RepID=UPI00351D1031
MTALNKQTLREAAEKALPAMQRLLMMPNDELFDEALLNVDGDVDAANAFNLNFGPETALALLDENLQLQRDKDSLEAVAIAMRDDMREAREKLEAAEKRIAELEAKSAPESFSAIGKNILSQDNRITSDPMFCVYQKREIVVDADYDYDRIVWIDEDGNEANERQRMRLELLHENFREPPEKWRRVALKEIDDFVTCCFTEQGCKDYLACNGHNLRLPFIYVKSGFRNAEFISVRNWLAGIGVKGD